MSRLATFCCERCGINYTSSVPSRHCSSCANVVRAERLREYRFAKQQPRPVQKSAAEVLREIKAVKP